MTLTAKNNWYFGHPCNYFGCCGSPLEWSISCFGVWRSYYSNWQCAAATASVIGWASLWCQWGRRCCGLGIGLSFELALMEVIFIRMIVSELCSGLWFGCHWRHLRRPGCLRPCSSPAAGRGLCSATRSLHPFWKVWFATRWTGCARGTKRCYPWGPCLPAFLWGLVTVQSL